MKALLLLFLIYINYVACLVEEWNPKKPYPKKVSPELYNRHLHLRRFIIHSVPQETTTKKKSNLNDYTVFPLTGDNEDGRGIGIPNSPYFPSDDNLHIKKDSFQPTFRRKRSVALHGDADIKLEQLIRRKRSGKSHNKRSNKKPSKSQRAGKSKSKRAKPKSKRSGKTSKKVNNKKGKKQSKVISRRLIAAKDAMIEEYPYTVSIQKGRDHWCSGALLNQRIVITTANCVWKGSRMSRLKVRVGSRHVDRGGQIAKIQEVMRHPRWNIRSYPDNDVALLLLDRRISFSHSVHGVDLPNRIMLPPFNDAWITSYGANRKDGLYPETDMTLQVVHAHLIDRDKCNNVTMRFGVAVTENFICLSQLGRRAPCTRDTGAPAVSDGVVWGLASWGIRKLCGTSRFPAVFSYLASPSNMDFITNATKVLMSEQRFYPFLDRFPKRAANLSQDATTDQYYTGQH